ncbi:MAG: hypothetical protein QOI55_1722, partial [Actinomycetota bacterium]|nr:hypothetical protein [Actinomycetota bacterium]
MGRMGAYRIASCLGALTLTSTLVLGGCGGDDASNKASESTAKPAAQRNACPVDGCKITILDVKPEGKELRVTWKANYAPDFSKNHIHIYWDTYTADQVSNDAADRGVKQGEWVPTADYPEFVTKGAVSTAKRAGSTKV